MIRLLAESDRDMVLGFMDRDHELNIIMICDIIQFGLDDRGHIFQGEYYGAFRDGELGGVGTLYNFGSMFFYAPDEALAPVLFDRLAALERTPTYVIGRIDWTEAILQRLMDRGLGPPGTEVQEYMALTPDSFRPRYDPSARFAEPRDLESIIRLHRSFQLEYFGTLDEAEEELGKMAQTRMDNHGIALAEVEGEVVAKAEVMARTGKAALIGGVFTVPELRGRGLAFGSMSLLCRGILASGENACLNVSRDNTPAQRVYREIGFRKLCDYRMAHFA
jgi:uncharacterized protein